jgi:hypothetical protein
MPPARLSASSNCRSLSNGSPIDARIFIYGWALVTAVILKVMGPAGASGGTRFALLQSVATSAVASMAWIDGLGYKYFGPEGLPGIDMTVGGLSAVAFLVWFWWDGQRRREVHS